jgi:hypothetical protein
VPDVQSVAEHAVLERLSRGPTSGWGGVRAQLAG